MSAPLFLCVHVPEFPAQARLRHRPEMRGHAVVILEGVPPFQQVCSTTRRAQRQGIARGMTRAELDSFADVTMLMRSLPEERSAQAALLELIGNFTPRVELLPQKTSVCAAVLDVAGSASMFGTPQHLLRRVQTALQVLGVHARFAVSTNVHAAVCAAPFAGKSGLVIAPGCECGAMADLPLTALPLSEQQAAQFELWGLRTCGELAALPEVELIARLGQQGKRLRLLARGEHPHLLVPQEEAFALEEQVAFESPVEVLDSLLFVLGPMLDALIGRSAARSLALASVTVTLQLDGAAAQDAAQTATEPSCHTRTVKPALPLMDREMLLKLMHLDLQAHPPSAAITGIHLKAEPGDRSKVQLGLFAPQLPEPGRLDMTLARIAALVGEDRVGRARLLDTHKPDSFVMERFTSPANLSPPPHAAVEGTIALRRMRPPVLLRLRVQESRPVSFPFDGQQYAVEQAFGPWRQSGQWWSADIWSQEEWDIRAATPAGNALMGVLVHDLLRGQWRLEALYD